MVVRLKPERVASSCGPAAAEDRTTGPAGPAPDTSAEREPGGRPGSDLGSAPEEGKGVDSMSGRHHCFRHADGCVCGVSSRRSGRKLHQLLTKAKAVSSGIARCHPAVSRRLLAASQTTRCPVSALTEEAHLRGAAVNRLRNTVTVIHV